MNRDTWLSGWWAEQPAHIGHYFEKHLNDILQGLGGINLAIQDSIFVKLIWNHGLIFRCFCGVLKGAEHKFFLALKLVRLFFLHVLLIWCGFLWLIWVCVMIIFVCWFWGLLDDRVSECGYSFTNQRLVSFWFGLLSAIFRFVWYLRFSWFWGLLEFEVWLIFLGLVDFLGLFDLRFGWLWGLVDF